ncbi:MAG: FHA domain-containing protein [Planctomycetota bacterium]|nr:MAG: FHA domain-containing protein [Planctomycetota bacterium]
MSRFALVVERGRSKGKSLRLKPNGAVVVGREGSNHLVVSDPQASRKHFRVEGTLGEFVLEDLGSSNGTFVNGQRVAGRVTLREGDKIALGETLVYFLQEAQGPEGAPRRGELTGREVAGYRIGRLLGRGGMGTVYEAVQMSLERTVAFKTLAPELVKDPQLIERFIAEARAAGRLSHANLVAVFDVGREGDLHYYSMEYMAGGSVEDRLRAEGRLPFEETLPIVFDAARGLEYAQKHGLVHRDIKPDNLMIGADGVVKISDLGLATFSTRPEQVSGSPHYIAPEQALGREIDHRADLYALGVTWYHLLCGETPFSGSSPAEIARKHVEAEPPPLAERAPDVPRDVVAVVERLMAKDPEARLPSARKLQADLAALARKHPVRETVLLRIDAVAPDEAPSPELSAAGDPPPREGSSVRLWALVCCAAALLVTAFLVTFLVVSGRADEEERARAQVRALEQLLAGGDPEKALQEARALAERLESEGFPEEAAAANSVLARAEEAIARRRQEERERALEEEVARARALARDRGEGEAAGLRTRRLEQAVALLDEVIKTGGDLEGARAAQALRDELLQTLDRAREAEKRRAELQADAGRRARRLKRSLEALLAEEREGKYTTAHERLAEFREAYGEHVPRAVDELSALVRDRCRREVKQRTALARRHAGRGEWAEAKAALRPVTPPLGFPQLEAQVREAFQQLDEARRAEQRRLEEAAESADRRVRASARALIADALRVRDFVRAARTYRAEVAKLTTERHAAQARVRSERLSAAARALKRMAEYARSGKGPLELEVEFKGAGRRRAPIVEVDYEGRHFLFQYEHRVRPYDLDEFTPEQLLELCGSVPLDPRGKLDLACLAFELGRPAEAEALLSEATALDPSLRRLADDLRLLERE